MRKLINDLDPRRVAYECRVSAQTVKNWMDGAEPKARQLLKLVELHGGTPAAQLALARKLAGLED